MLEGDLYSRQNLIQDVKVPQQASIIGCGGTGFWTALFLAMSGVEHLILIDDDIVEASNLNRLPIGNNYIGISKTHSARQFIHSLRPNTIIEEHHMKIQNKDECNMLRGHIFCCTDNLKSQQLICAYAKKNELPYQRIGYDGTILNVSKAFPLSFNEDEGPIGYTQTPSWVIPAVVSAALGVSSKLYKELCIMDDLGKICIKESSYIPKGVIEPLIKSREQEIRDIIYEEVNDNPYDYISDEYGYCPDCERGDCDNCDYYYNEDQIEEIQSNAHDEGYEEGKDKGYEEGYEEGKDEGYEDGYEASLKDNGISGEDK